MSPDSDGAPGMPRVRAVARASRAVLLIYKDFNRNKGAVCGTQITLSARNAWRQ